MIVIPGLSRLREPVGKHDVSWDDSNSRLSVDVGGLVFMGCLSKVHLASAKWFTWHGKGRKAVARLQGVTAALEAWPQHEYSTLWWNVRLVSGSIRSHEGYLVKYGARWRKGLPISSSIADSAVNEVVSLRTAKKQPMRWSDEGRIAWRRSA